MLTLCFSVFPGINPFGLSEVVIISSAVQVFSGRGDLCPGASQLVQPWIPAAGFLAAFKEKSLYWKSSQALDQAA